MNNKSDGVDIKAINKKIESESAFVDILKLEINNQSVSSILCILRKNYWEYNNLKISSHPISK